VYESAVVEVQVIVSPVHAVKDEAETEGAGALVTFTVTGSETSEQPFAFVTVTV
jgi:hypothetical protein